MTMQTENSHCRVKPDGERDSVIGSGLKNHDLSSGKNLMFYLS